MPRSVRAGFWCSVRIRRSPPIILAVVLPLSAGSDSAPSPWAGTMAIVSGVVCMAAGLARLGFITELISKPIRYGYMNGIALTVMLSQIPKLLGFSVKGDGPLQQVQGIGEAKLSRVRPNRAALAIGAAALALILLLKRWRACARHPHRGGGRDIRRRGVRSRDTRRRIGAGSSSAGPTGIRGCR